MTQPLRIDLLTQPTDAGYLMQTTDAAFAIALGALGMLDELEHHDSTCYT